MTPPARTRRALLAGLAAGGLSAAGLPAAAAAGPAALPAPAADEGPRMQRGVNLSHWFEYERGQGVTPAELRGLRAHGLDHVRVPVDPLVCGWRPSQPEPPAFLHALRQAAAAAVDAGLEVVVDLHLEPGDKARFEADAASDAALERLWSQMAAALSALPAQRVAFELYNEPQYYGRQAPRWPPLQRRLLAAVRAAAPRHRVLVCGAGGASIDNLLALAPLPDARLTYVFHCYEPFLFTHQGVAWLNPRWTSAGLRRGLRWPPQPEDRALPLSRPHPRAQAEIDAYVDGGWGAARLAQEVGRAAGWGRRHGVPVVCNEFGCIRAHVDPASRYRWLGDLRRVLHDAGIGWTVWDYTDIFGLTAESAQPGREGRRTLEAGALAALGLAPGVAR